MKTYTGTLMIMSPPPGMVGNEDSGVALMGCKELGGADVRLVINRLSFKDHHLNGRRVTVSGRFSESEKVLADGQRVVYRSISVKEIREAN